MKQEGPGLRHPDGRVAPGVTGLAVSQRLAPSEPIRLGAWIPGLKMLPLSVAPPRELFWLPRICSTVTTHGVQCTLGFHDVSVVNPLADPIVSNPKFKLKDDGPTPSNHVIPNVFLVPTDVE
jgi:hypothetical protein